MSSTSRRKKIQKRIGTSEKHNQVLSKQINCLTMYICMPYKNTFCTSNIFTQLVDKYRTSTSASCRNVSNEMSTLFFFTYKISTLLFFISTGHAVGILFNYNLEMAKLYTNLLLVSLWRKHNFILLTHFMIYSFCHKIKPTESNVTHGVISCWKVTRSKSGVILISINIFTFAKVGIPTL